MSEDISLDMGQTNSYSLSLQNTGEHLLAAMASVPGMPGEGPSGAQCYCAGSAKKKFLQELVGESKGAVSEPKRQTDP